MRNIHDSRKSLEFPQKLFDVLQVPQYRDIVRWLPGGKAFVIIDKKRFISQIVPKHFKKANWTSFTRKLNRWKFSRVSRGPLLGAYYHALFRRDNRSLCRFMSCNDKFPTKSRLDDELAKIDQDMQQQYQTMIGAAPANRNPAVPPQLPPTREEMNYITHNHDAISRGRLILPPSCVPRECYSTNSALPVDHDGDGVVPISSRRSIFGGASSSLLQCRQQEHNTLRTPSRRHEVDPLLQLLTPFGVGNGRNAQERNMSAMNHVVASEIDLASFHCPCTPPLQQDGGRQISAMMVMRGSYDGDCMMNKMRMENGFLAAQHLHDLLLLQQQKELQERDLLNLVTHEG